MKLRPQCRLIITLIVLGWAIFPKRSGAEETGPVLKLPPLIIEGIAGPKWRYAHFPGYEILSRCDDTKTQELYSAFYRAHELLGSILPARFHPALDVPKAMLFYDEELWPIAQRETVAAMLGLNPPARPENSDAEETHQPSARDALVPIRGSRAMGIKPRDENRTSMFFSNMCLGDADSITTFALVSRATIDEQDTYLTPAYVEMLLNRRTPQLPAWFRTGFLSLYQKLDVHGGTLAIRRPNSVSATSAVSSSFSVPTTSPNNLNAPALRTFDSKISTSSLNGKFARLQVQDKSLTTMGPSYLGVPSFVSLRSTLANGILPIEKVLDPRALENGMSESTWLAEIELFVRWGIDHTDASRNTAFWRLVERSTAEPVTEGLFQECFGLDYAQVSRELAAFLPKSDHMEWSTRKVSESTVPLELRDATRGEISRIKGEWERLETRYIRMNSPDLENAFLKQARGTLHRAFDGGDRDPGLVATLALLELDAGESRAAREYLEAVPKEMHLRPRANFELARLRYEETDGRSTRDDGKISGEQAVSITGPLLLACRQKPSIPQVYELMADVYVNCVAPPQPATMEALNEGVMLFPNDADLVYRVALLTAANDPRKAASLIDRGLQYVPNESDKIRFLELRGKLALPIIPHRRP